jgi:two-component system, chemotaxis family, sensor kinase CheA
MNPSQESSGAPDLGIDLSQFTEVFFEEAGEHLANMESLLLAIGDGAPTDEDLNAIFRAAHSVKGGAAMFGFRDVTELTHDLESMLDAVRRHELKLTPTMIEACLEARDLSGMQLAQHKAGTPGSIADPITVDLRARLRAFKDQPAAVPAPKAIKPSSAPQPIAALTEVTSTNDQDTAYGRVRNYLVGRGARPETADYETVQNALQGGAAFVASAKAGEPTNTQPASAPVVAATDFEIFETPAAPVAATAPAAAKTPAKATAVAPQAEAGSIRVAVEKVDQLINMVGELVITQAMLQQRATSLDTAAHRNLVTALTDLERNTRALQEAVMSIRMLPVSMVFNRFPRMVRDLAAKLGKKVELQMSGEGTEVDKGMIEKIVDPLTHLVRNSMDHGIEAPDKRLARGKSAHGTVTLRAYHQGGTIVIEVVDDGAGLNRPRILEKARERGMAIADTITDAEVWQLIFEAGFSTAAEVTDVSGRGVGMDVVKRNISSLGGSIEIESNEGKGSIFRVRLPLTLAIMDGMSVSVGDQIYIIQLGSIIESLQIGADSVRNITGAGRVVRVRDEYLPVVVLRDVFQITSSTKDESDLMMVIVEADGVKTAILVDDLVGQHQVVVKNLEANYKKVHGVSAATIMGDGRVGFIVDVPMLVRKARH